MDHGAVIATVVAIVGSLVMAVVNLIGQVTADSVDTNDPSLWISGTATTATAPWLSRMASTSKTLRTAATT